jgi:hypothetical protein
VTLGYSPWRTAAASIAAAALDDRRPEIGATIVINVTVVRTPGKHIWAAQGRRYAFERRSDTVAVQQLTPDNGQLTTEN